MKRNALARALTVLTLLLCSSFSRAENNPELPIVVVICSFNNKNYYQRNLDSVYYQNYSNYRVIYINDCSTDGTGQLVETYLKEHNQESRTTLIHNAENHGAMYNLYYAIHSCHDNEIVVTLDGDDWLDNDMVFQRLNRAYSDPNVWLTYGQFRSYPSGCVGFCETLPAHVYAQKSIRHYTWVTSHLRTFYAWLFKLIKEEDLKYQGKFYHVTWDQALMLPMLEMADFEHSKFIPDVLYVYNNETPLSDDKLYNNESWRMRSVIRALKPYDKL